MKFDIRILSNEKLNEKDDNVDVEIILSDGKIFSATFFTIENIKTLFKKNQETGECLSGQYFWATDMILVEKLTETSIRECVNDLINTNEISSCCTQIH